MNKPKVFLTGGDNVNWALDDDLRLTRRLLEGLVQFTSIKDCDVIHCVSWLELLRIPDNLLFGKHIICHIPGEPFRYLSQPGTSRALRLVGKWITRSTEATEELDSLGIANQLIPYVVDPAVF